MKASKVRKSGSQLKEISEAELDHVVGGAQPNQNAGGGPGNSGPELSCRGASAGARPLAYRTSRACYRARLSDHPSKHKASLHFVRRG
jgi:hypothetical protein